MNIKYIGEQAISHVIEKCKFTFASIGHTHTASEIGADATGSASAALALAEQYTDTKTSGLASSSSVTSAIDTHNTSSSAHSDIRELINEKANTTHSHAISDVTNLQSNLDAKVPASRTVNGKTLSSDIILSASDVDAYTKTQIDTSLSGKSDTSHNHDSAYDAKGSANTALEAAKAYTDNAANTVKNDLLNGAGEAYDTLKELGVLIDENQDAIEALETVATNKADKGHTHSYNDLTDKPFGVTVNSEVIVPETTFSSEYTLTPETFIELIEGNEYTVIYNGTEYTCTASYMAYGSGSWSGLGLGNGRLASDYNASADYPFCVLNRSGRSWYMLFAEGGDGTVEVLLSSETIVYIDEQYIPDTIARTEEIEEINTNIDTIETNVAALDNTFIATYGETTYEEIRSCLDSGKLVFCVYNNKTCPLVTSNMTRCSFSIFNIEDTYGESYMIQVSSDNEWSVFEYKVPALQGLYSTGYIMIKISDGVATFDSVETLESTALILSSPNGTRFNITIGDDGILNATEITV